jgi:hypothetical protein
MVKMRFNPVGLSATLTTCKKGITNLLCLPRTAGEIEALKLFEQAVEETKATKSSRKLKELLGETRETQPMNTIVYD